MTDSATPAATRTHWHLDKTISVGHLLTTAVIAVSALSWASAVDRRVEQNAIAIKYLGTEQAEVKEDVAKVRDEIRADLRAISQKLDRLAERRVRQE